MKNALHFKKRVSPATDQEQDQQEFKTKNKNIDSETKTETKGNQDRKLHFWSREQL